LVQFGIGELKGRLGLARRFDLVQEMGYVLGPEGARGESFF
jgi:hypothetical protein